MEATKEQIRDDQIRKIAQMISAREQEIVTLGESILTGMEMSKHDLWVLNDELKMADIFGDQMDNLKPLAPIF